MGYDELGSVGKDDRRGAARPDLDDNHRIRGSVPYWVREPECARGGISPEDRICAGSAVCLGESSAYRL